MEMEAMAGWAAADGAGSAGRSWARARPKGKAAARRAPPRRAAPGCALVIPSHVGNPANERPLRSLPGFRDGGTFPARSYHHALTPSGGEHDDRATRIAFRPDPLFIPRAVVLRIPAAPARAGGPRRGRLREFRVVPGPPHHPDPVGGPAAG